MSAAAESVFSRSNDSAIEAWADWCFDLAATARPRRETTLDDVLAEVAHRDRLCGPDSEWTLDDRALTLYQRSPFDGEWFAALVVDADDYDTDEAAYSAMLDALASGGER